MLRRLRQRRSFWSAIAIGILAVPAMLGGSAASPAESQDMLPPPELNPLAELPPDPADLLAKRNAAEAAKIADLAPEQFRSLVVETAHRYEVDPRLIASVITVETEWVPDRVGSYGERGLMQVLPSTGRWLAGRLGLDQYDLSDPATSVQLGSFYLSALIKQYGTPQRALAAYNGGPSAAENWQTNIYVRKVMKVYDQAPKSRQTGPKTGSTPRIVPYAS